MSADTGHGTIPERLIVLEEAPDDSNGQLSAEELLRRLAAEGNIDAKEAVAFLAAKRSQRRQR
jgi:hypothetical protein